MTTAQVLSSFVLMARKNDIPDRGKKTKFCADTLKQRGIDKANNIVKQGRGRNRKDVVGDCSSSRSAEKRKMSSNLRCCHQKDFVRQNSRSQFLRKACLHHKYLNTEKTQ